MISLPLEARGAPICTESAVPKASVSVLVSLFVVFQQATFESESR